EVGELSAAFQVKLLRVLQEGEIRPLGSGRTRQVDVRVIAATNRDLEAEVAAGRFREDLYYRLATVTIRMPPLRERLTDVPKLASTILQQAVDSLGKRADGLTDEAIACMQRYTWPGNVRELKNEVQRMLVEANGPVLGAELLSARVLRGAPSQDEAVVTELEAGEGTLKSRIESIEVRILRESLIRNRWNKSRAARELGLSRVGLRSKLERYGLEKVEHFEAANGSTG
ncbi:MAG: sigma 54-interacting transcriptional regulator, partial [Pseudomonadota bacterium]